MPSMLPIAESKKDFAKVHKAFGKVLKLDIYEDSQNSIA